MAYRFNIFTGTLDIAGSSGSPAVESEFVTHEYNPAGGLLMVYDIGTASYVALGPLPIVTNDGNLVRV